MTIAEPLSVGVYEVTFAEWDACVSEGGCYEYRPDDQGWGRGRRPVFFVSWVHARAYVEWLSAKTGRAYRLLSESEWEYAARAGTTAVSLWSDAIAEAGELQRKFHVRFGAQGTVSRADVAGRDLSAERFRIA